MFEIGNSLREARLRQQLQFSVLEERTKVRPKYLRALEDEQFDLLPAPTYVKGFLKAYADALGLDGQLYVDEFNSRFVVGEEDAPFRARRNASSRAARRVERIAVLIALVAIGLVTAVLVFGVHLPEQAHDERLEAPRQHRPRRRSAHRSSPAPARDARAPRGTRGQRPRGATTARSPEGSSSAGRCLPARRQRFVGSTIWVKATPPSTLDATLNGIATPLVAHGSSAVLVFGPHGQLTG